jgi:germacradienol/geosmin synthase
MGMLEGLAGAPGGGVWDEEKLASYDFAACAARLHPDASASQLDVSSAWLTWGTYGDDFVPRIYGTTRDLAGCKAFNARLPLFMPVDCGETPPPVNPAEKGLAELWKRTASSMSLADRRSFREGVQRMTSSWVWELQNHIENRIPDPVDYIEMRRNTFGSDLTMNLARITQSGNLPPELFLTRPMVELEHSAQDFLGIERSQAVRVVNDLMTSRMKQFEHILATDLPSVVDSFELDEEQRATVQAWVVSLQDWMAGILDWHRLTGRYDEAALRRSNTAGAVLATALPSGPTGLGTSAARIASARSA